LVTVSDSREYIGCGVSLHPPDKVVKADVTPDSMQIPKRVFRPDELGLRRIAPNKEIIDRCGRQVFRLIDEATGKVVGGFSSSGCLLTDQLSQRDVYVYAVFPDPSLSLLRSHTAGYSQLKGIQRGQQFDTYSTGNMVPRGERAPKGGAPGDSFGFYADMTPASVDQVDLVNVLFDHAEVCLRPAYLCVLQLMSMHRALESS
jgi:hypothetical protein